VPLDSRVGVTHVRVLRLDRLAVRVACGVESDQARELRRGQPPNGERVIACGVQLSEAALGVWFDGRDGGYPTLLGHLCWCAKSSAKLIVFMWPQ
jgi:hypothetical protein